MVGLLDDPLGTKKQKRKPITTKYRMQIARGFGMKCPECGRRLNRDNFHVDHKRGNPSSRDIVDVKPLCIPCHRKKTAKDRKKRAKKKEKSLLDNPLGKF